MQLGAIRGIRHIRLHDIRPGFVRTPMLADGCKYPLQLEVSQVARDIIRGIERNKSVITVDWKYRLLVFFWQLIPRWMWIRMKITTQ